MRVWVSWAALAAFLWLAAVAPAASAAQPELLDVRDAADPPRADGKPHSRINQGDPTTIEQVPWQVAFADSPAVSSASAFDRQFCGGTLMTPRIVVTAAHCFVVDGRFQHPSEVSMISGRTQLTSSHGSEIPITTYHLAVGADGRPLYDNEALRWDVAIVELPADAIGTPIKIAGDDERALWAAGQKLYATGWGSLDPEQNDFPDILQIGALTSLRDSTCSYAHSANFQPELMKCTSGIERTTCGGDSGGPLVAFGSRGEVRLIGASSWGPDPCGVDPAVFTRLAADPIRGFVRDSVQQLAGVDVVGSGAAPASSPPSLTEPEALQVNLSFAWRKCLDDRRCRRYSSSGCKPRGGSFRCDALNLLRSKRRGKISCRLTMVWSAVLQEPVTGKRDGDWGCRNGWR